MTGSLQRHILRYMVADLHRRCAFILLSFVQLSQSHLLFFINPELFVSSAPKTTCQLKIKVDIAKLNYVSDKILPK